MRTSIKIFHWLPRIISILAILFISMFALDAFDPQKTFWQQIGHFLMHLVPSFILIILLLIAWKKELTGGIIFTIIGLGFSPLIFMHNYSMNQSIWMSSIAVLLTSIPFAVVGILFILSHRLKQRDLPSSIDNTKQI